jgi:hypothetical protein
MNVRAPQEQEEELTPKGGEAEKERARHAEPEKPENLDSLSINDECYGKRAVVRKKGVFSNGVNLRKAHSYKGLYVKC